MTLAACPRAGVVYKYVYLGGGVVVGWGGGVLNLAVALVWPQAGRKSDGKARQGDDEPMEAMPEQSQHGVRAAQSGPACGT